MKLKPGNSDRIITENIEKLIREGYSRSEAVRIAFEYAKTTVHSVNRKGNNNATIC